MRINKNIQDICEIMGKWSCLAFCYAYAALRNIATPEEINNEDFINVALLSQVYLAIKNQDYLDEESTVLDAAKYMHNVSNLDYYVEKKDITSLNDIKNIPQACVRYDYNGHSHWVYVEFGKIAWNSMHLSKCVTMGKPTTARVIHQKQKEAA